MAKKYETKAPPLVARRMVAGDYGRVAEVFCENGIYCTAREVDNIVVPGIVDARVAISSETGRMVGFVFLQPERLLHNSIGLRILQIAAMDRLFSTFQFLVREAKVGARSRKIRLVHVHMDGTTVVMREWLRRNMFLPLDFSGMSIGMGGTSDSPIIWYYEATDRHRGTCVLAGILDDSSDVQTHGKVLCDI